MKAPEDSLVPDALGVVEVSEPCRAHVVPGAPTTPEVPVALVVPKVLEVTKVLEVPEVP